MGDVSLGARVEHGRGVVDRRVDIAVLSGGVAAGMGEPRRDLMVATAFAVAALAGHERSFRTGGTRLLPAASSRVKSAPFTAAPGAAVNPLTSIANRSLDRTRSQFGGNGCIGTSRMRQPALQGVDLQGTIRRARR